MNSKQIDEIVERLTASLRSPLNDEIKYEVERLFKDCLNRLEQQHAARLYEFQVKADLLTARSDRILSVMQEALYGKKESV